MCVVANDGRRVVEWAVDEITYPPITDHELIVTGNWVGPFSSSLDPCMRFVLPLKDSDNVISTEGKTERDADGGAS